MLFFRANGRLGNQLFQYSFIKSLVGHEELILTSGFEELKIYFYMDSNILNINRRKKLYRIFVDKILINFFNILSQFRIISCYEQKKILIDESYYLPTSQYIFRKGLFSKIKYIKFGFFQSSLFFKKNYVPKIKQNYIKKAKLFLEDIKNKYKVFIHIRRGDYLNWKVLGVNPLLPIDYFKKQIEWFKKNRKNVYFIFLSDDPDFIEKEFKYLNKKKISKSGCVGTDLAIMMLCEGAIISNSSLSWWGAYLMKKRDKIFAPKYWLGFKQKIWYPQGIKISFVDYIDIN